MSLPFTFLLTSPFCFFYTHSTDQRTGTTHFEYDKLGRITKAGNELFAFDPAHNILSDHNSPTVPDNRLKTYNGSSYYYDHFGNLIHRELADGEVQNYFYDLHDQLVKAEIFKKDGSKETWTYTYDALGRRIGKGRLKNEEASDGLEEETRFVWDGSHLLQEVQPDGRYTYIYTDPDSYEPLAQVRNHTNAEGESKQEIHYFHCDQIGIPREMTDDEGNLVWFGNYTGWGKLKSETNISGTAHQPFRLQNQYADRETGLHYNFFRYYEPNVGRFVNQDPIGLEGGENLHAFAPNVQEWVDPLGLSNAPGACNNPCDNDSLDWTSHGGKHVPPKNSSWSKVRKATKNGEPAKYKPEIHIESLERTAWTKGTPVSSFGKNVHYKVYDAGKIIGASEGIDTPYIRVECSQGVIHGHPITKKEYLKRLGAI